MDLSINQWIAFIDRERGDLLTMAKQNNKVIEEADEMYNVLTGDDELKRLEEIRIKSDLEEQAALATAKQEGIEEGIKQGIEQGIEQGFEESQKETIRKLLDKKFSMEEISEILNMSINKIKKLMNDK